MPVMFVVYESTQCLLWFQIRRVNGLDNGLIQVRLIESNLIWGSKVETIKYFRPEHFHKLTLFKFCLYWKQELKDFFMDQLMIFSDAYTLDELMFEQARLERCHVPIPAKWHEWWDSVRA